MNEYIGKHAVMLFLAAAAILTPAVPIIIFTGILVFSDTITGVWAALKRGEKVTSKGLGRTVTKILLYSLVIGLTFAFEHFFTALKIVHMGQIASGYICLVELKSIYENVSSITGLDIWTQLMSKFEALRSAGKQ